MKQTLVVFMLLCFVSRTTAVLPIIIPVVVAGGAYYLMRCQVKECCNEKWIPQNFRSLKSELDQKVFGQHIAVEVVFNAVAGHVSNRNPEKALVLSFHGWTGCGKNHVSRLIADHLYKKGMDSQYAHQLIASHDFQHKERVAEYKDYIQQFIINKVKKCSKTLFIFDEMDKVPAGLMDALRPFLEHHRHVNGIDYRKCIFIFLSNTGAKLINKFVFDHWDKGNKREDITIKEMDLIINNGAFNSEGGLWHSELILHNLIDFFVPFLPLEKSHVKQCIEVDLIQKGKEVSHEIIKEIADEMQYSNNAFSTSGCKKVSSRVDYLTKKS